MRKIVGWAQVSRASTKAWGHAIAVQGRCRSRALQRSARALPCALPAGAAACAEGAELAAAPALTRSEAVVMSWALAVRDRGTAHRKAERCAARLARAAGHGRPYTALCSWWQAALRPWVAPCWRSFEVESMGHRMVACVRAMGSWRPGRVDEELQGHMLPRRWL